MLAALLVALAGPPAPPVDAAQFNHRRIAIHRNGMATLTGWALANIGLGLGLGFTTDGPVRHFHQMNAYWNTVNLALGVVGLVGVRREGRHLGLVAAAARARKHQSVFTWNAGLDVLYMATGAVLLNLGSDRDDARLLGYGASVMAQGGFLLVFDLAMAAAHARNARCFQVTGGPTAGGALLGLRGAF